MLFGTLPQRRLAAVSRTLQAASLHSKRHEEDTSMAFCNMCGAQIADGTTTCSVCAGKVATAPASTTTTVGGMTDNVAGMLAYITIIPAIIFLVMEPYNKNRFVRFHSWQNIFLCLAAFVCWIAFFIVSAVLAFIPILGHLIAFLLWIALSVGLLIAWVLLLIKPTDRAIHRRNA